MREAREEGAKQVKESAEKTQWCECVGVWETLKQNREI